MKSKYYERLNLILPILSLLSICLSGILFIVNLHTTNKVQDAQMHEINMRLDRLEKQSR
jgi:hypothetical protein